MNLLNLTRNMMAGFFHGSCKPIKLLCQLQFTKCTLRIFNLISLEFLKLDPDFTKDVPIILRGLCM